MFLLFLLRACLEDYEEVGIETAEGPAVAVEGGFVKGGRRSVSALTEGKSFDAPHAAFSSFSMCSCAYSATADFQVRARRRVTATSSERQSPLAPCV